MKQIIYIELYKLARSPRTYLSFAIGAVLMLIIHIGLYTEGEAIFAYLLERYLAIASYINLQQIYEQNTVLST